MKSAIFGLLQAALLAGCAANPTQSVYIMPAPVSEPAAPGGLALIVRPVMLPDYLDTTDLVTRTGQYRIEVSRTGRWGERLSHGVTRSLAADLGHRLHAYVFAGGTSEVPALRVEVKITAFDVTTAASVLAASWTIVWPDRLRRPVSGQATVHALVAPPGDDPALVAAMAETVAALADGIVATIQSNPISF